MVTVAPQSTAETRRHILKIVLERIYIYLGKKMGDRNCMIQMEHVQCPLLLMHKLEKHERGNM